MKSRGYISLVLSECLKKKKRGEKKRYFKHLNLSGGSVWLPGCSPPDPGRMNLL